MNPQYYYIPWKHLIIDDFISKEESTIFADYIQPYYDKATITGDNMRLHIKRSNPVLGSMFYPKLQSAMDLYFSELNFGEKVVPPKYYLATCVNIVPPGYQYHTIHEESENKIMTVVMYAHNETGTGTSVYYDNTLDSYYGDIEWKRNRALCFVGQKGNHVQKTWHDFCNKSPLPRMTVNMRVVINDPLL